MTSLLASSRKVGNLKLFWFHVHSELQRKTTQNQKLALSSSLRTYNLKRMAHRNKKGMLRALEAFARVCVKHFNKDSFEQNLVVRSLLGPSFKLRQLLVKKDAFSTIFNSTIIMEGCKPAVGLKIAENKRIMPAEQRANSLAIS